MYYVRLFRKVEFITNGADTSDIFVLCLHRASKVGPNTFFAHPYTKRQHKYEVAKTVHVKMPQSHTVAQSICTHYS